MADDQVRIGWIGLGKMGIEIAKNLQKHQASANSLPIVVYNRTKGKCKSVVEQGAKAADSIEYLTEHSDVIFLSLVNDSAVNEVVKTILQSVEDSKRTDRLIIADTTTVHPNTTQGILDRINARKSRLVCNVDFCQTPVWGAPPAAKAAKLVFVTSGKHSDLLKSIAVPAIGRTTIDVGEDQCRAARFKILGNFMIAATIEALGEGMAVAEEAGIGKELYLEFIKQMFPVPPAVGYAEKMVEENGEAFKTRVGFNVPGGMKDVKYAIDVAKEVNMRLPIAELAYEHLQWVLENGSANWDWSSICYALKKENINQK